uniref:Uncharacterized protein n=1 Tax=Avena sativa TaxID=4498 RepID=A0ACD5ZCF8_AVESA
MEFAGANLTEVVRSLRLLKIEGYSMIRDMGSDDYFKYRWIVDGYEWEIRVYPRVFDSKGLYSFVAVQLIFLSEPRACAVRTTLRCCLVGQGKVMCNEYRRTRTFRKPQDSSEKILLTGEKYIDDDSFAVQCILEVFKELPDIATVSLKELQLPSSNLHQHFSQLLQSGTGSDVTFLVSGESFAAHKLILAARSPVFMAEFFGDMTEKCSPSVEIEDMEAAVFKALLHFIYTDTVPEFGQQEAADAEDIYIDTVPELRQQEIVLGMAPDYIPGEKEGNDGDDIVRFGCFGQKEEAVMSMAQHLLAAADRYGLDRLKLICVGELSGGINVGTAATTLALAEQHNCPELKERCVEFIIRTSATLDAVLRTKGYKHLEASCPLVVIDIFKAARGRRS